MLACAVSIIIAFASGCGWLINRMDVRFARMEVRIDEKFAAQDARIDEKFAAQDTRIDEKFARVDRELAELRIAIARLEGPPRRLATVR